MITVKYIPNRFDYSGRKEKNIDFLQGMSINYYIQKSDFVLEENFSIIVSGKKITDLLRTIKDNDEIIIIQNISGPFAPILTAIYIALTIASIGYSIYAAVQGKRMKSIDTSDGGGIDENSQTYAWDGIHTVQSSGIPVPIVYGEHKVGGNIINQYIEYDGNKNYLNVLIGLCEGQVSDISNIKINDNPIENFDGITVTKKYGTNSQTAISGYELQHNLYVVNTQLNTLNSSHIYTTIGTDIEGFEVHLEFPSGIYQINSSSGAIENWSVLYKVEHSIAGAGSWTTDVENTVTAKNRTSLHRNYRKLELSAGQYDIRVTRTSAASSDDPIMEGNMTFLRVDELKDGTFSYPNTASIAIEALATDQLNGTISDYSCVIKGLLISIPKIMYSGADVAWEDYYYDNATSEYKRFSDNAVCSWDGSTYITAYNANPIWCMRNLLTNSRYGLGEYIDSTFINTILNLEMSRYCEERVSDGAGGYEKRFRLDVVIDSPAKALDVINQICASFRGLPFYSTDATTSTIHIRIDKSESPVQLFTMGNIISGSFSQSWKSIKEVYNVIEVQYLDKDKNYEQDTVVIVDEAAITAGNAIRKYSCRVFTTRASQAIRYGKYILWLNKYLNRSINFKAGVDSVAIQPGDVFSFAHDVPQWGFSGRICAGSTTTIIKLNQSITLSEGVAYVLQIQFSNDVIEEKNITNSAGTYTEVTVSSAFSYIPAEYDKYSIGTSTTVKKDFRCMGIEIDNQLICTIHAIEYNSTIYTDSGIALPTSNYSLLDLSIPSVENLKLTERLIKLKDGTIENAIDVWFETPEQSNRVKTFNHAKIYISHDGVNYRYHGLSYNEHYQILGDIVDTETYYVKIVSVSSLGEEGYFASSPTASITIVGKSAYPSNVTTFLVNRVKDRIYFGWEEISDVDLWYYEIRLGTNWEGAQTVVSGIKSDHYYMSDFKTGTSQKFWIKARDTSGNYSETALEATVTIDDIPFENIVQEYSEQTSWTGNKVSLIQSGDNLEISGDSLTGYYETPVRDLGYLATFGLRTDVVTTRSSTLAFSTNPSGAFDDDPTLRFSGSEEPGASSLYIKTSEDNITWGDYIKFQQGDYKCRYFQKKLSLTRTNSGDDIECSRFDYTVDLPDVDDFGTGNVFSAESGDVITFTKTYHQTPQVDLEFTSGDVSFYKIENLDTTGFDTYLYDRGGTKRTGAFKWKSHGV